MNRERLSQEAFDKLLLWFDADRETAAKKYQTIQLRLIGIFSAKGHCDPEDLADQSFNVAAVKIDWLLENYVGDPALYIYAIAKKIVLEQKRKPSTVSPPVPPDSAELERRSICLDRCLDEMTSPAERHLVIKYHAKEKQEKIQTRRQMAEELGISINALRIRVCNIHTRLRPCIQECLRLLDD